MKRRTNAVVAVTLAVAGVAACSDDTKDTADESSSTTSAADTATPLAITAVDYAFEGLPDEVAAGTVLELDNESTTELHELVALRLPDDEARSTEELAALPPAELEALFAGPPEVVLVAPPGGEGFAALGDTVTDPGRYLFMCFIPTGADPQAYLDALEANPGVPPEVPGGAPHFTAGMVEEVTVR